MYTKTTVTKDNAALREYETAYYTDANGNVTAKQTAEYTTAADGAKSAAALSGRSENVGMELYGYDKFNRLIRYNSGSKSAAYTYGVDNLRAGKTVNGERTEFAWDGQNLAAEYKKGTVNTYTYDPTGVVTANKNGAVSLYVKDYHGNVVGSISGGLYEAFMEYDAFGNVVAGAPDPFGYCGEYYDSESGLVYLRNRYYDSEDGRFITEDPAKDGVNWYAYCGNNPVNAIDPSGLYGEELISPWVRQQRIWLPGVYALQALGLSVSAEMLHHAIRWWYADDVYIKDEWNGVEVTGSNRINGDHVVYALRNNFKINNEIDWQKSCAQKEGRNTFYWSGVLALNDTTDLYLSFNNATVTINGYKNANGSWTTRVTVYDEYDFDIEKFNNIDSFKSAIGGAAGTVATLEQVPLVGSIKTYEIYVEFLTER